MSTRQSANRLHRREELYPAGGETFMKEAVHLRREWGRCQRGRNVMSPPPQPAVGFQTIPLYLQ